MSAFKLIAYILLYLILGFLVLLGATEIIPKWINIISFLGLIFITGLLTWERAKIRIAPLKKMEEEVLEYKKNNPNKPPPISRGQMKFLSVTLAIFGFAEVVLVYQVDVLPNIFRIIAEVLILAWILFVFYWFIKPKYCPNCSSKLPIFIKPLNENEKKWGWRTCPKCKIQMDADGNIINL